MIRDFMEFSFLQNALWTGIIIGFLAPLLGVFVVIRRQSLIADALSHVTLAGISFSLLLGKNFEFAANWNPMYMGMVFSVAGSLMMEKLRTVYRHYQELAIPIVLSAGIGLSAIFLSIARGFNTDLYSFLFGSVSAVSRSDFYMIAVIAVIVVTIVLVLYKELFLLSFDEEYAKATGLNAKAIHLVFIVIVALVIAASMRVVGILLVSSLMTLPVAASIRIAKGFKQTIILSMVLGQVSVLGGIFLAYGLNLAPGGTIVMISVAILIGVILYKKIKSL